MPNLPTATHYQHATAILLRDSRIPTTGLMLTDLNQVCRTQPCRRHLRIPTSGALVTRSAYQNKWSVHPWAKRIIKVRTVYKTKQCALLSYLLGCYRVQLAHKQHAGWRFSVRIRQVAHHLQHNCTLPGFLGAYSFLLFLQQQAAYATDSLRVHYSTS